MQPPAQMGIENGNIRGCKPADNFSDKRTFNGCQLGFDAAGNIETAVLPIAQGKIRLLQAGRDRYNKKVAGKSAPPDYNCGPHFGTAQVRERNRQ